MFAELQLQARELHGVVLWHPHFIRRSTISGASSTDTMMTSMAFAQVYTRNIGQQFVVFTCDLQLYRVALEVQWTYPERFSNVILRLGGMHSLMSFIGSIGTLMADTGLSDIMSYVFGGVSKMLTGKKFPQNIRALRMVAEEALRGIIQDEPLHCSGDLMQILETEASKSNYQTLGQCLDKTYPAHHDVRTGWARR